jgi:hypothetical protein
MWRVGLSIIISWLIGIILSSTTFQLSIAATASTAWEEDSDGHLQLDDTVLGTWCYAERIRDFAKRGFARGTIVYERNNKCFDREDWIVFKPTGYRTVNSTCSITKIDHGETYKTVAVSSECKKSFNFFGPSKIDRLPLESLEQIEMGFTSDDYLYIIPNRLK